VNLLVSFISLQKYIAADFKNSSYLCASQVIGYYNAHGCQFPSMKFFWFLSFLYNNILLLTYVLHRLFLFLLQPKRHIFVYLLLALFMGPRNMVDGCKGSSRLVDCCFCCTCLSALASVSFLQHYSFMTFLISNSVSVSPWLLHLV